MSKTLSDIRNAVYLNTGRSTDKASLIDNKINEALDIAIRTYPFRDAVTTTDIELTEDATSQSLSAIGDIVHVLFAMIYDTDGDKYKKLTMKDNIWWNRSVIDADRNTKGWPTYIRRDTDTLYFDRPLESDITLRIATSGISSMSADSTVCPVSIIETFLEQYATAMLFLSIENQESYMYWKRLALGSKWDDGIVGGSLKHAINSDSYDLAEEFKAELGIDIDVSTNGMSILNNNTDHDDFGNIRTWY